MKGGGVEDNFLSKNTKIKKSDNEFETFLLKPK